MADGTVRLTVDAQELQSRDIAQLFETLNLAINFLIVREDAERETEPPKPDKKKQGEQTQSQRLRQAIWNKYQTLPDQQNSFEDYYKYRMDLIIDKVIRR
jgi:hypothetical protein